MQFIDLSTSKKTSYVLTENEKAVFFLRNRSGSFEFILAGSGAEAHVFALFDEKGSGTFSLNILQHHKAPDTVSTSLTKSLLAGTSSLAYEGRIRVEKDATGCDAKQENRNLLLSESASAVSVQILEILTDDVSCEHASATGTVSEDAILYMKTRGLDQEQAEELLAQGFRNDFFNEIARYGEFSELKEYTRSTKFKITSSE